MRKILFALPLLCILIQCSNPHKSEIAELDRALKLLDSAKAVVLNLDSGLIFERRRQIHENLAIISATTDTLLREDVFLLDKYSSYFKAYNKWGSRILALYEEVEVVPMQITNLKSDLSKNLIDKEKSATYVKKEIDMTQILLETISNIARGTEKIEEPYIETEEKILLLIQRLESQKQTDS